MFKLKNILIFLATGLVSMLSYASFLSCDTRDYPQSPQFHDGQFKNANPPQEIGVWENTKILWNFTFNKPAHTEPPNGLPVVKITSEKLALTPDNTVFRLGHSTLLLKMKGKYWVTDPVFSKRASPVQWAGPKRFQGTPISIAELPPIEAVMISHDHYDHLDYDSIMELKDKTRFFLTPLGVGDLLISWGVPRDKVIQLDWWDTHNIDGITFVSTPAQHFSGRTLFDSNKRLWTSWTIVSDDFRLFFSGDTGYFGGFKQIGEKYGPFDMAFIENGAYDPRWADIHMLPEDTLNAFRDLRGKWLLPIHNSTFDLAFHTWDAPMNTLTGLAQHEGVKLAIPEIGEGVAFLNPKPEQAWWKESYLHHPALTNAE